MQRFSKGIENIPSEFITLLVIAGLLALVYILGIQNYFDVKVIIKEFQIERQTIDLAQAMISNEKLVYDESTPAFACKQPPNTVRGCAVYSKDVCPTQKDCKWEPALVKPGGGTKVTQVEGFCTGTARSCNSFSTETDCKSQTACEWKEQQIVQKSVRFHRAIFDKKKLDTVMNKGDLSFAAFLQNKPELSDVAYPNTISYFVVKDLQTDEVWSATVWGPKTIEGTALENFVTCMANSANLQFDSKLISAVFLAAKTKLPIFLFLAAWDVWDLKKCSIDNLGTKVGEVFAASSGITTKGFPVAIKSGDEIHVGKITVQVIGWL